AFRKGVFNYIKEETDRLTNEAIPRKYFSGGVVGNSVDFRPAHGVMSANGPAGQIAPPRVIEARLDAAGKAPETADAASKYVTTSSAIAAKKAAENAKVATKLAEAAAIWQEFLATEVGRSFSSYSENTGLSDELAGNLEGLQSQYSRANIGLVEARTREIGNRLEQARAKGKDAVGLNRIPKKELKDMIEEAVGSNLSRNEAESLRVLPKKKTNYVDLLTNMATALIDNRNNVLAEKQVLYLIERFRKELDSDIKLFSAMNRPSSDYDWLSNLNGFLLQQNWKAVKEEMLKWFIAEDVDKETAVKPFAKTWFADTPEGSALLEHAIEVEVSLDKRPLAQVLEAVKEVVVDQFKKLARDYRSRKPSSAGARKSARAEEDDAQAPVDGAGKAETTDAAGTKWGISPQEARVKAARKAVQEQRARLKKERVNRQLLRKLWSNADGRSVRSFLQTTDRFSGLFPDSLSFYEVIDRLNSFYNSREIDIVDERKKEIARRLTRAEANGEMDVLSGYAPEPVTINYVNKLYEKYEKRSGIGAGYFSNGDGRLFDKAFIVMLANFGLAEDRRVAKVQIDWLFENAIHTFREQVVRFYSDGRRDLMRQGFSFYLFSDKNWVDFKKEMVEALIVKDVDQEIKQEPVRKTWFAKTPKGAALLQHAKELGVISAEKLKLSDLLKAVWEKVESVVETAESAVRTRQGSTAASPARAGRPGAEQTDDAANTDVDSAGQVSVRASALIAAEEFVIKLWEESGKSLVLNDPRTPLDRLAEVVIAAWLAGDQQEFEQTKERLLGMGFARTAKGAHFATYKGSIILENSAGPAEVARLLLEKSNDIFDWRMLTRSLFIPYAIAWSMLGGNSKDTEEASRLALMAHARKGLGMSDLKAAAFMLIEAIRLRASRQKGPVPQAVAGVPEVRNNLHLWNQALDDRRSEKNERVAAAVSVSAALLGGTPEALELAFAIRYELNDHFVGNMHLPMSVTNMLTVSAALHGGYQSSIREVLDVFSAVENRWGKNMPIEKLAALVWGQIIFERNIRYKSSFGAVTMPGGTRVLYPSMIISREGEHFSGASARVHLEIVTALARGETAFNIQFSSFGAIFQGAESQDFPLLMEVVSRVRDTVTGKDTVTLRLAGGWEEKVDQYRKTRNTEWAKQGGEEQTGAVVKAPGDKAARDASAKQDGGIDLNAIDVNRTGEVNAKVFDDAAMATMLKDVTGFRPVILNIAPVTNLRLLLGMAAEDAAPTPATPAPLAFIRPAKENEES
ncbi:MAG: hypothetical protein HQL20_09440, partial [Candidatus Omnitrophica bacterium]|nr:hypothetical protein [Candidatus Omnitrophota bacterium]